MPRYFFNVHHDSMSIDSEGVELHDLAAAWKEATQAAGEMLKDLDGKLKPGHDWRMEITDELSNVLMEIQIKARRR